MFMKCVMVWNDVFYLVNIHRILFPLGGGGSGFGGDG
jgi:hypothetical protein